MRFFKSLALALILLCGLALTAQASTITEAPFSITRFVFEPETITERFTVPETGTYKALIKDLGVLESFESLVLAIINTDGFVLEGSASSAGSMEMFTFAGNFGDEYIAAIGAEPGSTTGVGLFHFEVSQVPIPPSLLLLGSGLVSLVVLRRRRS